MARISFIFCVFAALLAGCERGGAKIAQQKPPAIPVAHPVQEEVTEYVFYTGRVNSMNSVIIQPRVTGYLMRMPFKEGADVKKGDVLFEIDSRPYKAQLEAAKAQVAQNDAALNYAVATNRRFKELAKKQTDAVSARELDQYQAQEDQAIANLNFAKANLKSAELNLEWTEIRSPINGHISRYFLTLGNLVNQDVTQLTNVVSMNPIYVYFDMDEPTLLRIKRAISEGKITPPRPEEPAWLHGTSLLGLLAVPGGRRDLESLSALLPGRVQPDAAVEIALAGDDGYPHRGVINFMDNQVNPGTGSISIRGVFINPRLPGGAYLMAPGMFVRVRLPIGRPQQELLVRDSAVTSDQGLKYVYVVDEADKVVARRVSIGGLQDNGLRVITQGLKKDDWVVIGGLQQIRPNMIVQPEQQTNMPTLGDPAIPKEKGKGKKK